MLLPKSTHQVAIEPLERRSLFSASQTVPVMITPIHGAGCWCMACSSSSAAISDTMQPQIVFAGFERNINFLPAANIATPGALPDGYLPDTGGTYAAQGDNEYGWNRDLSSKTRYRTNTTAPDGRYATNILIGSTDVWEMAVPNGKYKVRLVAGDASYTDSTFKFNVEGQLAMDAKPSGASYWVERSIMVDVTDGRLTVSSASGAVNNKLAYLKIASAEVLQSGPLAVDWTRGSVALPFHRVENGAVQIGSKLYIMGGYRSNYDTVTTSFQVYDYATNAWTTKSNMPGAQTHFALATDGRYIYKVGGQYGPKFSTQGTNEGRKYDTQTGKWSTIANLPAVRFGGAMEYLNGKLHFWGGDDPTRVNAQADHWTLDLNTTGASWQRAPSIPLPGDHLSHAVIDGKIYSIGGEHDHGVNYVQHDYVFEFDPATNQWTRKADMPTPTSHFEGATFAYEGKIWAIGGQVDKELLSDEVRVYDPIMDKWTVFTNLPEKRKGGTVGVWQGKASYISGDSALRGTPGAGIPTGSWTFTLPDLSPVNQPMISVFGTQKIAAPRVKDLLF